jgi:hypothetical protein
VAGERVLGELLVRFVPHSLTSRVAAPKACGQEKVGSSSSPVIKDPPVVAMDSTVVASSSSAPPLGIKSDNNSLLMKGRGSPGHVANGCASQKEQKDGEHENWDL